MCKKRDVVVFLAGASTFHTLSHIMIKYTDILPLKVWGIEWTQQLNMWAILINGVITIGLLYWASMLKK